MFIDDLIKHSSEWLKGTGPHADIVISSRIRLARNFDGISFPHWATKAQCEEVLSRTVAAIAQIDYLRQAAVLRMSELDATDKQLLVERHLMSHEHAQKKNAHAVIVESEEIISVMVNEEDHLRLQVMQSGLNLTEAGTIINQIDDAFAKLIPFAFSPEWGYLTACPTNVGTGMRGSVMLHLPALVMTRQINRVLAAIAKLSFTTRGLYGEGTQATGNFFQISNQVSLGHSEAEIIGNINGLITQIVEQENQAREVLLVHNRTALDDRVHRSFGVLKNAYIISSQETIELLSMLRLGVDLGLIKDLDRSHMNELFIATQPAHLQKFEKKKLSAQDRDVKRADIIRAKLTT